MPAKVVDFKEVSTIRGSFFVVEGEYYIVLS